jgi:hypothetical protein
MLLLSELRLNRALRTYAAGNAEMCPWVFTLDEWWALAEIEGVLNMTSMTTTLMQFEKHFTGAYGVLIKSRTLNLLRHDKLMVVDMPRVTATVQ